jgi:hypothetical protein
MSEAEIRSKFKEFAARFRGQQAIITRLQVALVAKDADEARAASIEMLTACIEIISMLKDLPGCENTAEQIRVTTLLRDAIVSGDETQIALAMAESVGMSFIQACGLLALAEEMLEGP